MSKSSDVFRPSLTANEINSLIYELQLIKTNRALEPDAEKALTKLTVLNFKVSQGITKPAYVNTGRAKLHSPTDLMAALNDSDSNHNKKPSLIVDRRGNPNELDLSIYTEEQIEDATWASAEHLAQTGDKLPITHFLPKPVIVNDRRKSDDLNNKDDDSDLAAALLG